MLNYFELMGLPTSFTLDESRLQHNFRQLQTQYHPDNLSKASHAQDLVYLKPEQLSAVINEAYQTLSSVDSRAKHLLALQQVEIPTTASIRDLDFLNEAMTFRMTLDDANESELATLTAQLLDWVGQCSEQFKTAYAKLLGIVGNGGLADDSVIEQAIDSTQKLQFLVKLQQDVAKHHDNLQAQDTDDDDLYV